MMKVLWLSKDNSANEGDCSDQRSFGYFVFSSNGACMAGPYWSKNQALGVLEFFRFREILERFRENVALWKIVEERREQHLTTIDHDLEERAIFAGQVDVYGCDAEFDDEPMELIGVFDFRNGSQEVIIYLDANAKSMHFPNANVPLIPIL